jgi:hypothetical protein
MVRSVLFGAAALALTVTAASADDSSHWQSPQECYDTHIRLANGGYPRPSDHPSDLREYCEKAYAQKKCNFTCMPSRVNWEFVFLDEGKRFARLDAYFGMHRCTSFPLNMFVPECTDERNR